MKRAFKTLAALALALSASTVSAFDFGFELSNLGGANYVTELAWYTDHKATLWVNVPFDTSGENTLSIEGSLYAAKPVASDVYTWFADLDLFRLKLTPFASPNSKVTVDIGRIPESDITGFVLGQTVDGIEMHGIYAFGNLDLFAGYTGLLNTRKGGALMTDDDQADMNANAEKPYGLGSQHAIAKITIQLPQAIGSMDLLLEGLGEYDLRPTLDPDSTTSAHLGYGTLSLTAPLNPVTFATLSGTWQSGIKETDGEEGSSNSLVGSIRLDAYPSSQNQLFGQFVYSPPSGDFFDVFTPISYQSLGTLYSRSFENLMRASAGWNFNPLKTLNFDFQGKVFMAAETNDQYPDLYSGSEVNAGATLRATSDLKFRLDSIFWLPAEGDRVMQASLKAIFNF